MLRLQDLSTGGDIREQVKFSPETALFAAVLTRALMDIGGSCGAISLGEMRKQTREDVKQRLRREALEWVEHRGDSAPGDSRLTFDFICDSLEIGPDAVRNIINQFAHDPELLRQRILTFINGIKHVRRSRQYRPRRLK